MILQKTYLSGILDEAEQNRLRYDNCVKCLLADPQILARILKYTVPEFFGVEITTIMGCIGEPTVSVVLPKESGIVRVESLGAEDNDIRDGKILYDIRFPAYTPSGHHRMLINLEAQNCIRTPVLKYHLGNRIVYYMARQMSSQKNTEFTGSDYDNIRKVYSIWICMDAGEKGDSIISIGLGTKVLYGMPEWMPGVDLMRGVIINIRRKKASMKSGNSLIAMLEELLLPGNVAEKKRKLEEEHGLRMSVEMEGREREMCNLSEVFYEEGMEEGRKEGRKEGFEQGVAKAFRDATQSLMRNLGITEEEAMDMLGAVGKESGTVTQHV